MVHPVQDPDAWCAAVAAATERIRAGELTKVVLARQLTAEMNPPQSIDEIAAGLAAAHPAALAFLVDEFCGASPELLVARTGEVVRAQPMAGTTPRTGDVATDRRQAEELLDSDKNRWEHQITIDEVIDGLLRWVSYVDAEPEPSVVGAGAVQHLASAGRGPTLAPGSVGVGTGRRIASHSRRGRVFPVEPPSISSPNSSPTTGGATPAPWGGSTPTATANGRSESDP